LEKEAVTNPAIEIVMSPNRDYFDVRGRGEMQLGILIEEMRREGYEMTLSPPQVVKQTNDEGVLMEPWMDIKIEVDNEHTSVVIERMSSRGGNILEMITESEERQSMKLEASSSSFLGMRTWLREVTGGTAVVVTEFKDMRPAGPPPPRTRNGVLIANAMGIATSVDLSKAQGAGRTLFIPEGLECYPGMIFGEAGDFTDIDTNISRKHDGYQSAKPMAPPAEKKLEQALCYILDDEQVEVTPKRIVMRKKLLDIAARKLAVKKGYAAVA
jgi:GTP-binding protein